MNAANDLNRLVDKLAGHWTDRVLEILKGAGIRISVDMEIEAWRALQAVLGVELRWQRVLRFSTLVSLRTLMEQTLRKAALAVAQSLAPPSNPYEFKSRISQLSREQGPSAVDRELYAAIVRRPALRIAFKEPSRTDFTPRLRVPAGAGIVEAFAAV